MLHVLIPARKGSKGVPDKNLRPLGGKSLIERAVDVAEALNPDSITVSTDYALGNLPPRVQPHYLERPAKLCADDVPMAAVVRWWAGEQMFVDKDDDVLLLQPTNLHPQRAHLIRQILSVRTRPVVSVDEVPMRWHEAYQVGQDRHGPWPACRQSLRPRYRPNGLFYYFWGKHALSGDLWPLAQWVVCEPGSVLNIDTPDDWAEAERQYGG